jgi:hypothetical protein
MELGYALRDFERYRPARVEVFDTVLKLHLELGPRGAGPEDMLIKPVSLPRDLHLLDNPVAYIRRSNVRLLTARRNTWHSRTLKRYSTAAPADIVLFQGPAVLDRYRLDLGQHHGRGYGEQGDSIVGTWARAKQVKVIFSWTKERTARQGANQDECAPPPGTDPMEGNSAVWASELIDDETCARCAAIDGHEYSSMAEARADYPEGQYPDGGYRHCESEAGCRGTLVMFREK